MEMARLTSVMVECSLTGLDTSCCCFALACPELPAHTPECGESEPFSRPPAFTGALLWSVGSDLRGFGLRVSFHAAESDEIVTRE